LQVSDQIALSSSSFSPEENEEFIITTITYNEVTGKTTLTLNQPLKFKHVSLEQTINGLKIKTAAKVFPSIIYSSYCVAVIFNVVFLFL